MKYIEIITERLILKPLEILYLESVNEYAMDYENTKYMCYLPHETTEETLNFLVKVNEEWKKDKPDYLEFAVIYQDNHIGAVSVYFDNGTGELGWIINKKYWRNGFAYEASKALVDYSQLT